MSPSLSFLNKRVTFPKTEDSTVGPSTGVREEEIYDLCVKLRLVPHPLSPFLPPLFGSSSTRSVSPFFDYTPSQTVRCRERRPPERV